MKQDTAKKYISDFFTMKSLIMLSIAGMSVILGGCNSDLKTPAEISINFTGFEKSGNVLDYFDRLPPIAIMTAGDTLMTPSFERIIENDGIFYALDRNKTKVFGFDQNGSITTYISARGKSELEYIGIDDISWDYSKNCLAILAQTKILYADKSGHIFESYPLSTYYNAISSCGKLTVLSNSTYVNMDHSKYSLTIIGKDGSIQEALPTLPEYAPFCSINGPTLTSVGNHVWFSRLFDTNIYSISAEGTVTTKFHIDYDSSELIPEEGKEYECMELYQQAAKSKQFYAISDIQEGKENISYTTNLSGLMILSKESLTAKFFNYLYDFDGKVPLPTYIPVEGSGRIVFFYMSPEYFPLFAEQSEDSDLKELAMKITPESNPVLLPYRLK